MEKSGESVIKIKILIKSFVFSTWEPLDTSDSEPEAQPAAEKGSIEKTEKVHLQFI